MSDFGSMIDPEGMTDDEIYDLVMQHLREYPTLDAGYIELSVRDGHVTLGGRVGTDGQAQVAENAIVEVLGISDFTSELIVDQQLEGDMPEAIDDALAYEDSLGTELGVSNDSQSDTAAHLVEDDEVEAYGTHDMQRAIESGAAYDPPDHLSPDGYDSRERH
ncbi:MAG TPA: BON domain-containing protein [Longimicrobiaceae bacterium]|jgi:hypothetical protein|nr:BON domain-containing protein [Longimicrobiaceae bacterium]